MTIVTRDRIILMCPRANPIFAGSIAKSWPAMGPKYNLSDKKYIPYFLAQLAVESAEFTTLQENFNYSVRGLLNTFSRIRITEADANRVGRTPTKAANREEIANLLYGGAFGRKNLGNTEVGDGWKFRGRGFMQVTGRYNYSVFAKSIGMSLDATVNYLETPEGALESAMNFWRRNNLNNIVDMGGTSIVRDVTARINTGLLHLKERQLFTTIAQSIFL